MRTATMMLATVLLLGSASVAASECAWALWIHALLHRSGQELVTQHWILDEARPTFPECEAIKLKLWTERFVCLPDTIDPREKKE